MAGLYDNFQLANSRAIPQYQGSTVPELKEVAQTMQGRYDTGVQQSDLLDQSIKTSAAAPVDQPLLNSIKTRYRQKLQGYAQKGNYEDMWRDVALDARDFTNAYKPIAANQQAMLSWQQELHKQVDAGKLDPAVAKAKLAQSADTYKGLQMDPSTGQYTNHFQGADVVPSIDVPEKINKWLSESHAIEAGWKAEKDVNGWYVTNGTERKSLPWEKIKPVIDAGIKLDPEVKAYLSQEHELAPYYLGMSRGHASVEAINKAAALPTPMGKAIKANIDAGMDPVTALHSYVGDSHVNDRIQSIYDYARKGVQSSIKTEYGEKMDPITEEMEKKKLAAKDKQLFSVPFADSTAGFDVSNIKDFDGVREKANKEKFAAAETLGAFKNAPNRQSYDSGPNAGKTFERQADGTMVDVTADADKLRQQVKAAADRVDQFDAVKKAAADAAGFHPEVMSPETRKGADQAYQQEKERSLHEATGTTDREGNIMYNTRVPAPEDLQKAESEGQRARSQYQAENHPAYADYQKELAKRLQPQGVSNKLLVFNDDNMKKTLGDFADGAISDLGLKNGLVSLRVASGKHAGTDLTSGDYDDIKGKLQPLGITNDASTGETKIVMRAMQDIKGKKVKGENMIVSMKDVGQIDDYVRTHASPEEYHSFVMDRTLKAGMNNVAGTMNYPIQGKDGTSVGNIQITRKKSDSEGPGSFSIRIPTSSGFKQISADSYEGVIDILNRIQSQHQ